MFLPCLTRFLEKCDPLKHARVMQDTSVIIPTTDNTLEVVLFDHTSYLTPHEETYLVKDCARKSDVIATATNGRRRFTLPDHIVDLNSPSFVATPYVGVDPNPIHPIVINNLHHRFCPNYDSFVWLIAAPSSPELYEAIPKLNKCIQSMKEPWSFLDLTSYQKMVDTNLVRYRSTLIFNTFFKDTLRQGDAEVPLNHTGQEIIYGGMSILICNILTGNFKITGVGALGWEEARDLFMSFIHSTKPIGIEVDHELVKIGFTDETGARISTVDGSYMVFSTAYTAPEPELIDVVEEE